MKIIVTDDADFMGSAVIRHIINGANHSVVSLVYGPTWQFSKSSLKVMYDFGYKLFCLVH